MRRYGKVLFVTGFVVFLATVTFPFWYARGKTGGVAPELDTPVIAALRDRRCVEEGSFMREGHRQLLAQWRDGVVRRGDRVHRSRDGRTFERSLSRTCLGCHSDKGRFCDRCHDAVGARPACWQCHIVLGEAGR